MSRRSQIIFGLALLFAARTVWRPDAVSFLAMLTFLAAHYADRFFSAERVDSKALTRVGVIEQELKQVRTEITTVKLAQGMRNGR